MPTAPSVPQRHQSYGYEEGEAGELIMQFPADRGHTGRPGDTVGPAKYTPSVDAASAKGAKAVSWSKSRSQRTSGMGPGSTLDGPGPGAYQPPGALADSAPDASLQVKFVSRFPVTFFAVADLVRNVQCDACGELTSERFRAERRALSHGRRGFQN